MTRLEYVKLGAEDYIRGISGEPVTESTVDAEIMATLGKMELDVHTATRHFRVSESFSRTPYLIAWEYVGGKMYRIKKGGEK